MSFPSFLLENRGVGLITLFFSVNQTEDPNGTYASLHHVDVLSSLKILESNPIKSLAVKETIRVVGVLLKRAFSSGGGNAGNRKRKQDEIDVSSGYRGMSHCLCLLFGILHMNFV